MEREQSVQKAEKNDIRSLIQSDAYKKQFAMVLPKHMTADRMARVALTALLKTPKLTQCTPASLMQCLLDCSSYGLEPDGRKAHLIPYGDKCTLIIDYKGIAELVLRSGQVSFIHADVVCENDEFEENLGQVVKHKINRREPRGEPYAVYTLVRMKDGTESFNVMGKHEVEEIRDRFSAGWKRDKVSSPWATAPGEAWKKTCFRRHSKWLPLSAEIQDAIDKGEEVAPVTPVSTGSPYLMPDQDASEPSLADGKAIDVPSEPAQEAPQAAQEPKEVSTPAPTPEKPATAKPARKEGGPLAAPKRG